jgi:hypothetical protein
MSVLLLLGVVVLGTVAWVTKHLWRRRKVSDLGYMSEQWIAEQRMSRSP